MPYIDRWAVFSYGDVVGDIFEVPHVLDSRYLVYKKNVCFTQYPFNKYHIHRLGTFLSDISSNYTFSIRVICFYWGWWLGKTEFIEINAKGYSCLPNAENSTELCFDSGSHNMYYYYKFCVDWSIYWWWEVQRFCRFGWLRAKLVATYSTTACPWFGEV